MRLLDRLGRGAAVTKGGRPAAGLRAAPPRPVPRGAAGDGELPGADERRAPRRRQHDSRRVHPPRPDRPLQGEVPRHRDHPAHRRQPGRDRVGGRGPRRGGRGRRALGPTGASTSASCCPTTSSSIVGAAHPWHGRKQVTLEELRAEPLLLRERGSGTRAALEAALTQAGTDIAAFRVVGEMGSTQAIKQAVKAGVGVSLVSRRAVEEECRAGSVWCLRVQGSQDHPGLLPRHPPGAQPLAARGGLPRLRRGRSRLTAARRGPARRRMDPRLIDPKTGKEIRLTGYAACAG